ncbi:toxin glutamine deamidase domain-containing protein [Actinokineospora sp. HUAS TT18]|uniref:toxin glutamine deamidase domain-containing protein n=1 Tax=Actinokineospora sp. HUAS TT18 TaxID=3447451 RepID=UPI003F524828
MDAGTGSTTSETGTADHTNATATGQGGMIGSAPTQAQGGASGAPTQRPGTTNRETGGKEAAEVAAGEPVSAEPSAVGPEVAAGEPMSTEPGAVGAEMAAGEPVPTESGDVAAGEPISAEPGAVGPVVAAESGGDQTGIGTAPPSAVAAPTAQSETAPPTNPLAAAIASPDPVERLRAHMRDSGRTWADIRAELVAAGLLPADIQQNLPLRHVPRVLQAQTVRAHIAPELRRLIDESVREFEQQHAQVDPTAAIAEAVAKAAEATLARQQADPNSDQLDKLKYKEHLAHQRVAQLRKSGITAQDRGTKIHQILAAKISAQGLAILGPHAKDFQLRAEPGVRFDEDFHNLLTDFGVGRYQQSNEPDITLDLMQDGVPIVVHTYDLKTGEKGIDPEWAHRTETYTRALFQPEELRPGGIHAGNAPKGLLGKLFPELKAINPQFHSPESVWATEFRTNCQESAAATDRYLGGQPATEAGLRGTRAKDWAGRLAATLGVPGRTFQPADSVADMVLKLRNLGDGARAVVHGTRTVDGKPVPGHVFNAVVLDGEVYFVDGQNNTFADMSLYTSFELLITEDNGRSQTPTTAPTVHAEPEGVVDRRRPEPSTVHGQAHAAIRQVAADAGMASIVKQGNGYLVTRQDGSTFRVSVRSGALQGGRLVDVTIDSATNSAQITVSSQAHADVIPGLLAYRIAAIAEVLAGSTVDQDFLSPTADPHADPTMSPADQGTRAQLRATGRQLDETSRLRLRKRARLREIMQALIENAGLDAGQPGADYRTDALPDDDVMAAVRKYAAPPRAKPTGVAARGWYTATRLATTFVPQLAASIPTALMTGPATGLAVAAVGLVTAVVAGPADHRLATAEDAAKNKAKDFDTAQRAYETAVRRRTLLQPLFARLATDAAQLPAEPRPDGTRPPVRPGLRTYQLRRAVPAGAAAATVAALLAPPVGLPIGAAYVLWAALGATVTVVPLVDRYLAGRKAERELTNVDAGARLLDLTRGFIEASAVEAVHGRLDQNRAPLVDAGRLPFMASEFAEQLQQVLRRLVPASHADFDPTALATLLNTYLEGLAYGGARALIGGPVVGLITSRHNRIDQVEYQARGRHDRQAIQRAEDELRAATAAAVIAGLEAHLQQRAQPGRVRRLLQRVGLARRTTQVVIPTTLPAALAPQTELGSRPAGLANIDEYVLAGSAVGVTATAVAATLTAVLGLPPVILAATAAAAGAEHVMSPAKWVQRQAELAAKDRKAEAKEVAAAETRTAEHAALARFLTELLIEVSERPVGPPRTPYAISRVRALLDQLQRREQLPAVTSRSDEVRAAVDRAEAELRSNPGVLSSLPARLAALARLKALAEQVDRYVDRTGDPRHARAVAELEAAIAEHPDLFPRPPGSIASAINPD